MMMRSDEEVDYQEDGNYAMQSFLNHGIMFLFSLQCPKRANADHHHHHHQHHHHHHHIVERGDTLDAKNEPIRSSSLIRTLITLLGTGTERRSLGSPV